MFLVTWQMVEGWSDPTCSVWAGAPPALVMGEGSFTVEQVALPAAGEMFTWHNAEPPECEGAGWEMVEVRACHLVVRRGSDTRYLSLLDGAAMCFLFRDGWHMFEGGW